MSEQLWYTWSDSGFGTAVGWRVRAASKGLVNTESGYVRAFINLMSYRLPPDTDAYLPPKEAPLCLTFLRVGAKQEAALIQKAYTGLDGVRRPGAFFSHLLTALPEVPSLRPERQIAFSAREAIELWRSPFWRISESELPAGRRDLSEVSLDELTSSRGPLSARDVAQVSELFQYVFSAFLTLAESGEQRRIYIVAPPDTVAALIWGITHALPRTLTLMQRLTFSTFEHTTEDKAAPMVVGTCWLPQYAKSGHANVPQDLPPAYYQPGNPHGLAINSAIEERKTPFTPDPPEITRFVQFASRCFQKHTTRDLDELLNEAEKKNISTLADFLQLYASFQETLSEDEINRILYKLYTKVEGIIEKVKQVLERGKYLEMQQLESVSLEMEILKRENVRRSITLLMQNTPWWRTQGKTTVSKLCGLADDPAEQTLLLMRNSLIRRVTDSREWRSDRGQRISGQLRRLLPQADGEPLAILTALADSAVDAARTAQRELTEALSLLAIDMAERLQQAIGADDAMWDLWADALANTTPHAAEAEVWAFLLQQWPSAGMTSAYQLWWRRYGEAQIRKVRSLASQGQDATLPEALVAFAKKAAHGLAQALAASNTPAIAFFETVLIATAPYASVPSIWMELLYQLWQMIFTPVYAQWWREQGKAAASSLRRLAESQPQSRIAQDLTAFAQMIVDELHIQIAEEVTRSGYDRQRESITFLLEMLKTTVPSNRADLWTSLVQQISQISSMRSYEWELRALLLKAWKDIPELRNNNFILYYWLDVRWSQLGSLFALGLPEEWHAAAISRAIAATPDIQPHEVVSIVSVYTSEFEHELQQLISAFQTQQTAITFFDLLSRSGYPQIMQMLDSLMAASGYQKDVVRALFAKLHLETSRDEERLLEHHCKPLITSYELPPELHTLIRNYLMNFDVGRLQTTPTRELLQRLQQRNRYPELRLSTDLQGYVDLWARIAQFMGRSDAAGNWLQDLIHTLRASQRLLLPDAQKKLAGVLVPALIEHVTTEIDLGRAMDNLGEALSGQAAGTSEPGLHLLEQMAQVAGEKYGQERPPVRLSPYLKVVLGEARALASPEKEDFIDRCCGALLKHFDTKARDIFKSNPLLWPEEIVAEWRQYVSRADLAIKNATLTRFRTALQSRQIWAIVDTYDPALEKLIVQSEYEQWKLARKFVEACNEKDDDKIVSAHNQLQNSSLAPPIYTDQQVARLQQARQRQQALARPATPATQTPVEPRALVLPSALSPAPPAEETVIVASVMDHNISLALFERVYALKQSYSDYRKSNLLLRLQQLQEKKPRDQQSERRIKREIEELNKLHGDPEQLRYSALYDVIDGVLIDYEIGQEISQRNRSDITQYFDPERYISDLFNDFRKRFSASYDKWTSGNRITNEQVMEVLDIFYRRELLDEYLHRNSQKSLRDWLKEQKKSKNTRIIIDYEKAGIKPPEGSRSRFLLW